MEILFKSMMFFSIDCEAKFRNNYKYSTSSGFLIFDIKIMESQEEKNQYLFLF